MTSPVTVQLVLADQRLNKSEVIYTFLSPSPEHLLFPGTSQKKSTFFSMFKGYVLQRRLT